MLTNIIIILPASGYDDCPHSIVASELITIVNVEFNRIESCESLGNYWQGRGYIASDWIQSNPDNASAQRKLSPPWNGLVADDARSPHQTSIVSPPKGEVYFGSYNRIQL
jgi:hypothetical protein